MGNLKASRGKWREEFINTGKCNSIVLAEYKRTRDTEDWRTSSIVEELCEYILYLEEKLQ